MEQPRKGKKLGRVPIYSDAFKMKVAKNYIEGEYSLIQLGTLISVFDGSYTVRALFSVVRILRAYWVHVGSILEPL
jgi:hypothetical protein